MNCAETVYAAPEEDGEAVDPEYKKIPDRARSHKDNDLATL
jgi:hypothetical protein